MGREKETSCVRNHCTGRWGGENAVVAWGASWKAEVGCQIYLAGMVECRLSEALGMCACRFPRDLIARLGRSM